MTEAADAFWSTNPMQTTQSTDPQNGQNVPRSFPQGQAQHQSHFMLPTSSHLSHGQNRGQGPELQLEYFHDRGGIDDIGLRSFSSFQPQSNVPQRPVLGVGQISGNAELKYTAATATALAAHACPPDVFQFGRQSGNSSQGVDASPNSLSGVRQELNGSFNFAIAPPNPAGSGVSEGVPPHETFRTGTQTSPHHTQGFLDSSSYIPHPKRRREDLGNDGFAFTDASGSGDEDGGQFGYGGMGEHYEALDPATMVGQSPEMLSHVHSGLAALGRGVEHTPGVAGGSGQGDQGQQTSPDGKMKPVHRAACVRCKNLKVRCEFITDPNTCKRCLNGGHECAIPGRKKRRQPPKREHLLNQIRDQAQRIDNLQRQLEEHRRARLHNEPTRLSLSNTPLPRPGGTPASGLPSPSYASGVLPQPDVQAWIERARESIKALGDYVEGEEDIEGEEDEESAGDEDYIGQRDEHSWRDSSLDQDTDTEEGGITVEGPDDTDGASDYRFVRDASPATTVRSASREASAPPQSSKPGQGPVRAGRRKTPQSTRLANLPETPAAPLKLIADLSLSASGSHGLGSKSPRSAPLSGTSSYSRGSSIEIDRSSTTTMDSPSPRSMGEMTENGRVGKPAAAGEGGAAQDTTSDDEYGAVAPDYFVPRRGSVSDPSRLAPARHPVPHILMRGIVKPQEVETLFKIYFDKMNLSCSLLDPVLYTAQTTYWRSPFLFTVICAVASRYYSERPGLYEELITYAQLAAGTALINGPKTVETVSAYILLSLYPVPMRRWEEDRTWLYLGLAIRVATDLNLHHPSSVRPRNEQQARELLNRTRVWLNCCNLDISTSSWHGKASTIPTRDYVACHSESWYESSQYNLPNFDIHLSGYNFELRLMRSFKEKIYSDPNNPTGLNRSVDFIGLSSETDETLVIKEKEWSERLQEKTDPSDSQARFRNSLLKLAYRYSRLTVLSFGFQHSFGKGGAGTSDQVSFFDRCYRAATDVVRVFIDELSAQKEYIRHGPEAQCVFVTFASAFLVKLLHPKYASYLRMEQRKEIERLIRGAIDLLSSLEVVVDDRHSPRLWSRFLDGLLATPTAKVELSPSAMKGGNSLSRRSPRRPTGHVAGSPSAAASISSLPDSPPAQSGSPSYPSRETHANSPAAGHSGTLSPPPPVPAPAIEDHYPAVSSAPPISAFDFNTNQHQDAYQPSTNTGSARTHGYDTQNSLHMNVPEFFQPPLPLFDNDLLHQMQTMPDSCWQNMPGFNWMGILQSSDQDSTMHDVLASGVIAFDPRTEAIRY